MFDKKDLYVLCANSNFIELNECLFDSATLLRQFMSYTKELKLRYTLQYILS